jgi:hypothetical protein
MSGDADAAMKVTAGLALRRRRRGTRSTAGFSLALAALAGACVGGSCGSSGSSLAGGSGGATTLDAAADGRSCLGNADCDPTVELCLKPTCGSADPGVCAPRPGMRATAYCSPGGDPVCGCDGVTYSYACLANAEGVNVASVGACPLPDGGGGSCTSNDDCAARGPYHCDKAACGDATGVCRATPALAGCPGKFSETCVDAGDNVTNCTINAPYVCGCDHQTYESACKAASLGVSVASQGVCPPPPSGACTSQADCGDATFDPLVFCRPTTCDAPAGVCTQRTTICPVLLSPVCGCDGKTYGSTCISNGAGVGVAYAGPCRSGAITACDAGHPCPTGQRCVDDPRSACAPGAPCAGVCLTTDYYRSTCGSFAVDGGNAILSCLDGACVTAQASECENGACAFCITSASAPCDSTTPCPADQLCVPTTACDSDGGACPRVCIRP